MKRTISLVIASAAVAMALVSCTKESTANNEGEKGINADGTRTLTVSFATKATKTTLKEDGVTPVWAEGDKIFLADGNATDTYTVTAGQAGQQNITITTTLQGTISAVYPADAAIEEENIITGVKVGAVQDGTFGSANICMAEEETVGVLSFENKTAVFEVDVPAHTAQLVVTSLGEIDGTTGRRGETVRPINTEGADDAEKQIITVTLDETKDAPTTCYVAVLVDATNPVLLTNLNFDAVSSATAGTQGGVSPKYIKSKGKEPLEYKAAAGYIYTPVLHEYVVVNGKKWATMNIGATASKGRPDCWGYFLAWGAVIPIYKSFSINGSNAQFSFAPNNPDAVRYTVTWPPEGGFAACNAPYYNSTSASYDKYNGTDGKTVLDLVDDAAYYCWGGSWRMPTKTEFDGLIDLIDGYNTTDGGCDIGDKFFLTSAGMFMGVLANISTLAGNYWTSSLNTSNSNRALTFDIAKGAGGFDDTRTPDEARERSYGRTVRALSD